MAKLRLLLVALCLLGCQCEPCPSPKPVVDDWAKQMGIPPETLSCRYWSDCSVRCDAMLGERPVRFNCRSGRCRWRAIN